MCACVVMSESTFAFGQDNLLNIPLNAYEPGLSLTLETVTDDIAKAYFMKENKQIDPPDGFELSNTVRHEVCHQYMGAYYLLEHFSYELRFDGQIVITLCRPYCRSTLTCNVWG